MSPRGAPVTVLCADLWPDPATASALALLRWDRSQRPGGDRDVVAQWPGPWRSAFGVVGGVHVVNDGALDGAPSTEGLHDVDAVAAGGDGSAPRRGAELVPALLRDLHLRRAADGVRGAVLRRRLRGHGPVWVAGPRAARLLHYLPPGRRVVVHQPARSALPLELSSATAEDRHVLRHRPDLWIAGDEEAATALRAWDVRGEVVVVPDLLLLDEDQPDASAVRTRLALEHGVPETAPLVVSGGAIDWWDVPDAFVQVAWAAQHRDGGRDIHWVWLADHGTDPMLWPLRHDIAHAGLADVVHVVRWGDIVSPVLSCADVAMSSRRGAGAGAAGPLYESLARAVVRWAEPGERPGRKGVVTTVAPVDEGAMADAVVAALDHGNPSGTVTDVRARRGAAALAPRLWGLLHGSD